MCLLVLMESHKIWYILYYEYIWYTLVEWSLVGANRHNICLLITHRYIYMTKIIYICDYCSFHAFISWMVNCEFMREALFPFQLYIWLISLKSNLHIIVFFLYNIMRALFSNYVLLVIINWKKYIQVYTKWLNCRFLKKERDWDFSSNSSFTFNR